MDRNKMKERGGMRMSATSGVGGGLSVENGRKRKKERRRM